MALANDSLTVTPGSGATLSTHLISGKEHQVIMLADAFGHLLGTKETYSWVVPSAAVGASKLFMDLFNTSGSGKILRLLAVLPIVDTDVAVVGALGIAVNLYRTSAVGTGGTVAAYKSATLDVAGGTIWPADSANAALPAQVTARHLPTGGATISGWVAQRYVAGEETATSQAYVAQGRLNLLATHDSSQQLLTLREGEGILLKQGAIAATGQIAFNIIFTME